LFEIPVLGGAPTKLLDQVPPNFALSPNGKQIAFVRGSGERRLSILIIRNVDGSGERELASLPAGQGFSQAGPAWSPDGSMMAIGAASQSNPDQTTLHVVSVKDGAIREMNSQTWDQINKVAWLRDGRSIVFHARGPQSDYHIWLLDYPGGSMRSITNDLARYGRASVSISADDNSLLAVRGFESISVWVGPAADANQSRQITNGSIGKLDGTAGLAWEPDGRIVYTASFNNSFSLWIMNADGSGARQLTPSGFLDTFPTASSDGRYVVFQSNRSGGSEIWRVGADGNDMRQLTTSGHNSHPELTADGKTILYAVDENANESIWSISIDGGQPQRVLEKSSNWPEVSHDGKLLACAYADPAIAPHRQLAVFSLSDQKLLHHFDLPRGATFNNGLHWTPDDTALVYRDPGGGLWQQRIAGGAPEKVANIPNKRIYFFEWSVDGKRLALSYGDEIRDAVLVTAFR
jgi:Tol biopolymer transport system component